MSGEGLEPFAAFRWTIVPRDAWRLRPGDVAMRVGPPIDAAGLAPADLEPLLDRVRAAMLALERDASDPPR